MIFCCYEWISAIPVIHIPERRSHKKFSQIPEWIEIEVIELLKDFGFIEWRKIEFDTNIFWIEKENISQLIDILKPQNTVDFESAKAEIQSFFYDMEDILKELNIPPSGPKYWLFRFSSIFDIDVKRYNWWLSDFLDFLLLNLRESIRFYGSHFFTEIDKNSWLILESQPDKNSFYFSEQSSIELNKTVIINEIVYPVILRIVPGFASPGFYFLLSINTWNGSENICMQIGVRFEKINDIVTPVIHNIQAPMYNLAIYNRQLITTKTITGDMRSAKELLSQKSLYDFVGSVISAFFSWWYSNTQIIDWHESLWLKHHNQNRTQESIEQSMRMYSEAGKHITGIDVTEGRTSPTLKDILHHEISRINKLWFEEDCLRWIFRIVQRFVMNFSCEIKVEEMSINERELFFSYIGDMREALLFKKINPKLHSENK